jgi:hypothetical protein
MIISQQTALPLIPKNVFKLHVIHHCRLLVMEKPDEAILQHLHEARQLLASFISKSKPLAKKR